MAMTTMVQSSKLLHRLSKFWRLFRHGFCKMDPDYNPGPWMDAKYMQFVAAAVLIQSRTNTCCSRDQTKSHSRHFWALVVLFCQINQQTVAFSFSFEVIAFFFADNLCGPAVLRPFLFVANSPGESAAEFSACLRSPSIRRLSRDVGSHQL